MLENLIQTWQIAKTDHLGHLGDRDIIGRQKSLGSLKTYSKEIVAERNSRYLSEPAGEMILAHSDLTR